MSTEITNKINYYEFYGEYHGHKVLHLKMLLNGLKHINPHKNYIYLAGDSSLDNKYWLPTYQIKKAINGYQHILSPPDMKQDISYNLNKILENSKYCVINAAIEESTIAKRVNGLLPQDKFINEHIQNDDILIVSVGGNDIALSPSIPTMWNMGVMMYMNDIQTINKGPNATWGMQYFTNMFQNGVKEYVLKVIGNKRPKKIIICMIYYPDEQMTGSWADKTLGYLGYNTDPKKLQAAIKQIFHHATSRIKIPGSQVVPFPMYEILNGKCTGDYIQRVEPSSQGGEKLAQGFAQYCKE